MHIYLHKLCELAYTSLGESRKAPPKVKKEREQRDAGLHCQKKEKKKKKRLGDGGGLVFNLHNTIASPFLIYVM